MKRLVAITLLFLLVLSLVGCGKPKRQIIKLTLSTEDSEAILAAAGIKLPDVEDVPAAGSTIKWFAWYDGFHNYDEDEIVNTGFFTFTEKYGCEIEWVECTWLDRFDGLANLILGGTPPDFAPGNPETFPSYAIKSMFAPVDDYVDYDDPLWSDMKDFVDTYFSLGDKHYLICTDVSFGNVCAYNRRVIQEWGFDDPAELYFNDEWTWDTFYDMCVEFSDPDQDRYALDSWAYSEALMDSSGATVTYLDPELGKFVSNLDDPRLERAANLLYDLTKDECCYPKWQHGHKIRNDVNGGGIKEGLCLFWLSPSFVFTGPLDEMSAIWGDIEGGELMFVPVPRDNNGDGSYYIATAPVGYCIVNDAENPEGVGLYAACERFKVVDPTVISIDRRQLEETYKWSEEMLSMWDICYELSNNSDIAILKYGEGYGSDLYSYVNSLENLAHRDINDTITWAQGKEQYGDSLQFYIDELNASIAEYIS